MTAQCCASPVRRGNVAAIGLLAVTASIWLVWAGTASAAGPSFNCANARAASEKAICGSENLAWQDRQLTRLYGDVRRALPPGQVNGLKADQRAWLKRRNRCGNRYECLHEAYTSRIMTISARVPWGGTTGEWVVQRAGIGGGAVFVQHSDGSLAALFETVATGVRTTPSCVIAFDRAEAAGKGWAWSDRDQPDRREQPCELTIQAYDEGYSVEGNQACFFYCGMRATFTGVYLRKSR